MSVFNIVFFEKFYGIGNDFFVVDVDDFVLDCFVFVCIYCDCEVGIILSESE